METQLSKIEKFLQSIEQKELDQEQQSFIRTSCGTVFGGNNGRSNCQNYDATACGGVNKRCTNHGVCGTSDNSKSCDNKRE